MEYVPSLAVLSQPTSSYPAAPSDCQTPTSTPSIPAPDDPAPVTVPDTPAAGSSCSSAVATIPD